MWHVRRLRGMRTTFPHFKQVRVQYSTDGWRDPSLLATNHSLRSFPPADPFCGSAAVGVPKWSALLPFPWTFCQESRLPPRLCRGNSPPIGGSVAKFYPTQGATHCSLKCTSGTVPLPRSIEIQTPRSRRPTAAISVPSKKPRTPPKPANDRITTDARERHTNTKLTLFLPPRGRAGVSLKWRSVPL